MVTSQEQALVTKKFHQNQAQFRKYTAVEESVKNHIVMAAEPVFLSPLVDQMTGFGQVSTLTMIKHIFKIYREIEQINIEENVVKMMGP